MLTNRQVFVKDPLKITLPNDGVAKVTEPQTPEEWAVLRYELSAFVCEGEYRKGLDRILSTYLRNMGEPVQPAVWVSGFYGSGKSHLVRVLQFLWRDVEFPDGARARGLATLPQDIRAHLQELSIAGRREGGLWSAGGTLGKGAGDSVRLSLLAILFRSARLPEQYPAARFVLWLKQNNFYDSVRTGVKAAGKEFESELHHLYASPHIARSLLAAYPGFADSEAAAHQLLRTNFPLMNEISDEETMTAISEVLSLQSTTPGKLPCTLIVLDELQQYIGDNQDRTRKVQEVVESCCARFSSRLLFVATGQGAINSTPQLAKLQARFTVLVSLSDRDVETVVREVALRKAEDKKPEVQAMLEQCSGEIDRHLVGTKIAPSPADRDVMVADYPLLPVRRRFWESILRAVDRGGVEGQLRTQLRVVLEAVKEVANRPLGTVVAADRIHTQLVSPMLQAGTMLKEVDEIIRKQDDGMEDGKLRSRLCATIFLISQLPTDSGVDTGIRATADILADLLVEDLLAGSASLRRRIPDLLQGMVESGELMLVGQEYRLQTRESAAWEQDYKGRFARILGDDARIASDRTTELKSACSKALKDVTQTQGQSKTPRKIELCFISEEPRTDTGSVPAWIRDEWSASEKTVREDAQAGGPDSPTIYVFLPQRSSDDLKKALAGYAAATETLTRPVPTTREGEEARQGMATRQAGQRRELDTLIAGVLKDAKVFQGGGNEVVAEDLRTSVREAMKASLARLYQGFDLGDDPKWAQVKQRARQGSGDALSVLGYQGDVDKHPVCREVLNFIGTAGKKGLDIRKGFEGPSYGWPRDTAEGAVLTLVASGHLRASHNGAAVSAPQIDQSKFGQTEFRAEGVTLTASQRIAVRKLLTDAVISHKPNEEAVALPRYLEAMTELAKVAGGEAPLPAPPDVRHLNEMKTRSGNDLILAVYEQRERLAKEYTNWKAAGKQAETRLPRWQVLQRLLRYAQTLPVYTEVNPQVQAIRTHRTLLTDPNPVPLLCARLTDELRTALQAVRQRYQALYTEKMEALYNDSEWRRLNEKDQKQIIANHGLNPLPPLQVGAEAEVLATLDDTTLPEWENRTAAISERIAQALLEAAKRLEPKAVRVKLPTASLKTVAEVDIYLEKVRAEILEHVQAGRPVVL